jgi:hypothetical protein
MKLRHIKIIWLPILGAWSFLIAVYLSSLGGRTVFERPPSIWVAYVFVSGFLAIHASTELERSSGSADSVYKVSTLYSSVWTLLVATLIAFVGTLASRGSGIWASSFVLASLVVFLVTNGLSEYSNDQLNHGARLRAEVREKANDLRVDYKAFLGELVIRYSDHPALQAELVRVVRIIPYSSFFRSDRAASTLSSLRSERDPERLTVLLSTIE